MREVIDPAVLYALQDEIYSISVEHGWDDRSRSFGDEIALAHSELSEALEAFRDTATVQKQWYREDGKPEGVPSELADVIIRVLDAAARWGIPVIDAMFEKIEFNRTRPYRHGGKHL